MNVAQRIKEGLSIAGAIFGGFVVIIAVAFGVSQAADKIFGDHLLPRLLTVAVILSVLGWLVFRRRGTASRP
jgi:hypothetical protein